MEPKPAHLAASYGAQFEDESVAKTYATRPPLPPELFDVLESLQPAGAARVVLDLGCGTGEVAIHLAQLAQVDRIDAVDPSAAMLKVARARPGASHASLRFVLASAESFEFRGPYSLIVASDSLHWMDWEVVLPRIASALHPGAFLALVRGRSLARVPWDKELAELIPRYSTNREYRPYDLVSELTRRGLFREIAHHTTRRLPFSQTLDDYVESFHTRNGFSRQRMTPEMASEFDEAVRSMALPHCPDGRVEGETSASLIWGVPLSG